MFLGVCRAFLPHGEEGQEGLGSVARRAKRTFAGETIASSAGLRSKTDSEIRVLN